MISLVVLIVILGAGFARLCRAVRLRRDRSRELRSWSDARGHHYFGTDVLGRDYFSRVVYGIQTTRGRVIVAGLSVLIGVLVGAFAGYYGGGPTTSSCA